MSTEVTLPALGESVTEGTISRWLKTVGDTIDVDEPLVEVSTDKVDTEVPSPATGTLLEIRVQEDEDAEVGSVLAIIGEQSEVSGSDSPAEPEPAAASDPGPDPSAQQASTDPAGTANGTEVTLPALGESVTEGTISRWLKTVGDTIDVDEPLVEVSTDKVDTEVPSPAAGTLLDIRVQEDEDAEVGSVLAIIGDASTVSTEQPAAPQPPTAEPEPKQEAPTPAPEATPEPAIPESPASEPTTSATNEVAPRATDPSSAVYVTPLVRKLARENNVDLSTITGTGVGGRIRKQDVLDAAARAKAPSSTPAQPATTAPAVPTAGSARSATQEVSPEVAALRGTTEKMSRLRKVIASRMVESLQVSAQLTATVEVDMTAVSRIRKAEKNAFKAREGVDLPYLPFIAKAVVEALKQNPRFNANIDTEAGTITYGASENIGIAVDTPRGLLVPVIRDAGDLNISGLAHQISDLAARTRNNEVTPDELAGGTFTITDYGSYGALFDTPIVNQPEVAILGTGALVKRPVVVTNEFDEDTIVIRDMMYLSLSYDHRLIDSAVAARFLSSIKARLEEGDFSGGF